MTTSINVQAPLLLLPSTRCRIPLPYTALLPIVPPATKSLSSAQKIGRVHALMKEMIPHIGSEVTPHRKI